MIRHELIRDPGILIVKPEGRLEKADFDRLKQVVDPFIEANGELRGLMIEAESFPGWDNFAALASHFEFVREHHRRIARVAAVTDSGFLSILPRLAVHFIDADVRHFDYEDRDKALSWLGE